MHMPLHTRTVAPGCRKTRILEGPDLQYNTVKADQNTSIGHTLHVTLQSEQRLGENLPVRDKTKVAVLVQI